MDIASAERHRGRRRRPHGRRRPRPLRELGGSQPLPGARDRASGEHRAGVARAGGLPRGRPGGRADGRAHRAGARLRRGPGRDRPVARAHAPHRVGGPRQPHDDPRGRRAARDRAAGGREARPALPGGLRRPRLGAHRRHRRHQRRRQRRDPLRHDARLGARPRGGARRRHGHLLDEPHDQEQRGLRPQAAVHRHRGHARRRDPPGAAPARGAAQHADRAGGLRGVRRRDAAAQAHGRRARRLAVGLRGDVERVLPAGDDAAREGRRADLARTTPTTC